MRNNAVARAVSFVLGGFFPLGGGVHAEPAATFARAPGNDTERPRAGVRLLAAGRESEIFDLGDGRVLRRYKQGGRPEHEAMVMEHARTHGFPSPRVLELGAGELVLERVDGPSMVEDLARWPWRVLRHARLLAGLHRRLHRIEAPEGLEAAGPGDALLHLDLHPGNVLLSAAGPVVIDWTNSRRGDAALDVAMSWVILATSELEDVPVVIRAARSGTRVRSWRNSTGRSSPERSRPRPSDGSWIRTSGRASGRPSGG